MGASRSGGGARGRGGDRYTFECSRGWELVSGRSLRPCVGSIQSIFHFRPRDREDKITYLHILQHSPFENEAMQKTYNQFGFAGGFLCHSDKWFGSHLIEPSDVICHFAKTPLRDDGIMHVLPLNKVSGHPYPLTFGVLLNSPRDDGIIRITFRKCESALDRFK